MFFCLFPFQLDRRNLPFCLSVCLPISLPTLQILREQLGAQDSHVENVPNPVLAGVCLATQQRGWVSYIMLFLKVIICILPSCALSSCPSRMY